MTPRQLFVASFVICCGLIGTALYFQYVDGLDPCPLCILQRIAVIAIGLVSLAGALHNPRQWSIRVYALLVLIAAGSGLTVAGRHVWLQHLPADQVPACGPGLDYILDVFPLAEALQLIFRGSGECATISWTLAGLSMPGWMAVIFTAFVLGSLAILLAPWRVLRR
ncbi:MAG: disulfide bond formation protein B [Gammaproteobacteria bacterium]|nr:disulfide bond formation protein B [Gammaproteobacteria bacterium]